MHDYPYSKLHGYPIMRVYTRIVFNLAGTTVEMQLKLASHISSYRANTVRHRFPSQSHSPVRATDPLHSLVHKAYIRLQDLAPQAYTYFSRIGAVTHNTPSHQHQHSMIETPHGAQTNIRSMIVTSCIHIISPSPTYPTTTTLTF